MPASLDSKKETRPEKAAGAGGGAHSRDGTRWNPRLSEEKAVLYWVLAPAQPGETSGGVVCTRRGWEGRGSVASRATEQARTTGSLPR